MHVQQAAVAVNALNPHMTLAQGACKNSARGQQSRNWCLVLLHVVFKQSCMCVMLQVLHGGENLLDKVEQLKQRSAATKTQLEVAARQQEEQRRRLEQLQLERLDLDAQYSSLEVRKGRQQHATVLFNRLGQSLAHQPGSNVFSVLPVVTAAASGITCRHCVDVTLLGL
jgi:uncharacterized protein with PIN domain